METLTTADVVVVGTGPAGVSAAWPLVEAGLDVVLLDAGGPLWPPSPRRPPLADARGAPAHWSHLLGPGREALNAARGSSPKIRTSIPPQAVEEYARANHLVLDGFSAVGVLAMGGLSNVWGAGASTFTDAEMRGWPINRALLQPSYRTVGGRIGLSGSVDDALATEHGTDVPVDPALPLGAVTGALLSRYEKRATGFPLTVGRTRLAVLTHDRGGRQACSLDNFCMWRCARGSIYNAADDLAALLTYPNARLISGLTVDRICLTGNLWHVHGTGADGQDTAVTARRVVLGAGVLPTTRLVLSLLGKYDEHVRLLSTPSATLVALDPRLLGHAIPDRGVALGHLSVTVPIGGGETAFGTMFQADAIANADLAAAMPFSTRGATRLVRELSPALLLTLLFLPGRFSRNVVSLVRERPGADELRVSGGVQTATPRVMANALRQLGRGLRSLGTLALPGGKRLNPPGSESHYAGTLPMGDLTSVDGEVRGAPGLYVCDGSVLPTLPAKHHTFTVMANADRIGRAVAARR